MKKRIGLLIAMAAAAFLLSVVLVSAHQPDPPQGPKPPPQNMAPHPPQPPRDPLGDAMFPPELVMQHQRELALTDEQRTFMRSEINRTTTRFNELQWQLQDAMEALHETMKASSVNEQLALTQLDKVLDSEREIKRAHIELAIRIKNKLTPDQQAKLQEMKHHMRGPGGPGKGPGRPGGASGPGRGPGHGPGGPGPGGPPKPPGNAPPPELPIM